MTGRPVFRQTLLGGFGELRGRQPQRFRDLYRGRGSVEREFGRLKMDYGLAPLRVRGLERVALHADLVMLARLGQALGRAREVAKACIRVILSPATCADRHRARIGRPARPRRAGKAKCLGASVFGAAAALCCLRIDELLFVDRHLRRLGRPTHREERGSRTRCLYRQEGARVAPVRAATP